MYTTKNNSDVTLYYYRNDIECDDARVFFEYSGFSSYELTINVGEYNDVTKQIDWEPDIDIDMLQQMLFNDHDIHIRVRIKCVKQNPLDFAILKFGLFVDEVELSAYKCDINKQNSREFDDATLLKHRTANLYDPERFAEASKHLQDIMSKGCSDIFGHDVLWFKVTHDDEHAVHAFREYEFATSMLQTHIRVVIKDNEVPDNRTRFSEFDIDFQDELEIHIDKNEWKRTFGELIPSADDYFFMPLTNQMYIVNAPYAEKNFIQNQPYWKMLCVKYEKRNTVLTSEDVADAIDDLVDFSYDVTKPAIDDEKADITKPTIPSEHDLGQVFKCIRTFDGQLIFDYAYQNREKSYIFKSQGEFTVLVWLKLRKQFTGELFEVGTTKIHFDGHKLSFKTAASTHDICNIETDKWFALAITYKEIETMNSKHLISTIWCNSHKLDTLATVEVSYTAQLPEHLKMSKQIQYANVRVNKRKLSANPPLSYKMALVERYPASKQNYVIDNAMPELTEPKNQ